MAGPPDAAPEELVRTIIADAWLPKEVREPFIALAKAKAPQLLQEAHGVIRGVIEEAHVTHP